MPKCITCGKEVDHKASVIIQTYHEVMGYYCFECFKENAPQSLSEKLDDINEKMSKQFPKGFLDDTIEEEFKREINEIRKQQRFEDELRRQRDRAYGRLLPDVEYDDKSGTIYKKGVKQCAGDILDNDDWYHEI